MAKNCPLRTDQTWAILRATFVVALFLSFCLNGDGARAVSPAGFDIANRARFTAQVDGASVSTESNEVHTRVDEVLDVALTRTTSGTVRLASGSGPRVLAFVLRNTGNGHEAFILTAAITDGSATVRAIAIDSDGDGRFDATRDAVIGADGLSPVMDPGATQRLFVLLNMTGDGGGSLMLRAHAATGSGPPGTLFPGRGDEGGDAVVGAGTAQAELPATFTVSAPALSLVKSQRISAPDGSNRAVQGAIITYRIEAVLAAGSGAAGVRIVDPVPPGALYVADSLRLDGTALSDATDGDPGKMQDDRVEIALGDLDAPSSHVVTFQVKIQ